MTQSSPDSVVGTSARMRIVVLGYLVRGPIGGMAWHYLNYLLGLARLGHEVLFLEDSDDYASCYDPSRNVVDTDPTYGLMFAGRALDRLGLGDRWAYFDAHTDQWFGPMQALARHFCESADIVLNISGVNPLRPWTRPIPIRVLIDTDPAFTQLRHIVDPQRRALAEAHNRFATFGELIPGGGAALPDDGLPWFATRQPVVLDAWPVCPPNPRGPLTTVMQWDSYQSRTYAGISYGMKARSFAPFVDLPGRIDTPLALALGSETAPRDDLNARGWRIDDPLAVTRDPWTYQRYIADAAGEWSVAKHGYVVSRCGWFSERSACFLATGRPVIVQDTGFSQCLPTGRGLFAFDTVEGAVEAIGEVRGDYAAHCSAARQIAEGYFESSAVLHQLLTRVTGSEAGLWEAADAQRVGGRG